MINMRARQLIFPSVIVLLGLFVVTVYWSGQQGETEGAVTFILWEIKPWRGDAVWRRKSKIIYSRCLIIIMSCVHFCAHKRNLVYFNADPHSIPFPAAAHIHEDAAGGDPASGMAVAPRYVIVLIAISYPTFLLKNSKLWSTFFLSTLLPLFFWHIYRKI